MPRPVLVSACLLGLQTRYDGRCKRNERVLAYIEANDLLPIPICPEQLGGLPTPRAAARFASGDGEKVLDGQGTVVNACGWNLNTSFLLGATETLKIARLCGCTEALLKDRSPSCGVHQIYLGEQLSTGKGVASALLMREGLTVHSEEDL